MSAFHVDGWFFERLDEAGHVQISTETEETKVKLVVSPETWASILASVTPGDAGELYPAFFAAHVMGM